MTDQGAKILKKVEGAGANAPATKPKPKTFEEWVETMMPAIKEALPVTMTPERFARMLLTNYKTVPEVAQCTIPSVLGAAIQAAQIGLTIGSLGQAYLVPYKNNKDNTFEAQLQIGYQGYMELAYRTDRVKHIQPGIVYRGDEFDFEYGSNEFIKHKPLGTEEPGEKPSHYYAIIHYKDGTTAFLVRTMNQILNHAREHTTMFTRDGKVNYKSNWNKFFDAMALKTVIRQLLKTARLSAESQVAMATDGTIKRVEDGQMIPRNMAEDVIDVTNHNIPQDIEPDDPGTATAPPQQPGRATAGQRTRQAAGGDPGPVPPEDPF